MRIDVLTLFPEMFAGVLGSSILKRAATPKPDVPRKPPLASSPGGDSSSPSDPPTASSDQAAPAVSYHLTNIRDFAAGRHRKVDDRPFGGGPGMVMMCQPLWDAVAAVEAADPRPATRILMTPQGRRLDQPQVEELAHRPRLLIIAGHYEGIDERVIEKLAPLEISIGDYVLSGGELPAMVLIDAVVRLLPGVLGHEESAQRDSFSPATGTGSGVVSPNVRIASAGDSRGETTPGPLPARLLDCPHYTQPREWMGMKVPEVLLSGHHGAIEQWRREQALRRTAQRRPDLLDTGTSRA